MDKPFIEQQKNLALRQLESYGEKDTKGKKVVSIIAEYLGSLIRPEDYTENQKEDLRKLALELGYTEDTNFDKWVSNVPDYDKI